MLIPNAEHAIVAPEKLRDYLLNLSHRRGSAKARQLHGFGYRTDAWQVLEADLRAQHLTAPVTTVTVNRYGRRYEIRAALMTPSGRSVVFESIWQIDNGTDVPRFITMYPRQGVTFEPFSDVVLTADVPEEGLVAGDIGTVIERHSVPGLEDGYSVEFFDMTGQTVSVVTLSERLLRAPARNDRPAVRVLAGR